MLVEVEQNKFPMNQTQLEGESRLLQKLFFKNKNQHRKSLHFRKLNGVLRLLKKLCTISPPCKFAESKLPLETRNAIIDLFLLHNALLKALEDSYLQFRFVASQTYFMPLCLVKYHSLS